MASRVGGAVRSAALPLPVLLGAIFALGVLGLPPCRAATAYTWRDVVVGGGGFVSGIEFHPTEPGLAYARTDVGGAYRWDKSAGHWVPLDDDLGGLDNAFMELGVLSLALDPADPDRVYIACGQYNQWWAPAATVLRSTDRGATWSRTALAFKLGGNEDGRGTGERLVVDPHLGARLFLGSTGDGLWRSDDHGASFTQVATFPASSVTVLAFDASSGADGAATPAIYAGVSVSSGTALYRSLDGGTTWSAVPGQPGSLAAASGDATQPIPHHMVIVGGLLYVTYANALGPNGATAGAVWKLSLSSGAWSDITPTPAPPEVQGGFAGLDVDPANPSTVVVSTIDRWWPADEVYRSADGGATWRAVLTAGTREQTLAPWSSSLAPHWIADVALDPSHPERVLFTTGFGLFRTLDVTAASPTWTFFNPGLEETVPQALVSPPAGAPLVSVMGDVDGFRHDDLSVSPPAGRHVPRAGSNVSIDVAWLAPSVMARTYWSGNYGALSVDGGATWTEFASAPSSTAGPGQIALSADGARLVWQQPGLVPYYSTDGGASWHASSGAPAGSFRPIADRATALNFYLYDSSAGRVYRSNDGGQTFGPAASVPAGASPPVAVPGYQGDLWLPAWSSGLRRSTNGGTSFSAISSVQRAYQLGFGRAEEGASYPAIYLWGRVGSVDGLYRSTDGAATWTRIDDDAHQYGYLGAVIGDPRVYGRVYLATSGRGIVYGTPTTDITPDTALPAGWSPVTLGAPAVVGGAVVAGEAIKLTAGGADIWGVADQGQFAGRMLGGDAVITARVDSLSATNAWAKAGVMFRASSAADAPFAALIQRPDGQVSLQWRATSGAVADYDGSLHGVTGTVKYLRLTSTGGVVVGEFSEDGSHWTEVGATPAVDLTATPLGGLVATSHDVDLATGAVFSEVSLQPQSLTITTPAMLAAGTQGTVYATALAADGGFPGYTWAVATGSLPAGLSLSAAGALSGTPSEAGDFSFTAVVVDADDAAASRSFSLHVAAMSFAAWQASSFSAGQLADAGVSGAAADPDGDGVPNLVEWVLATDPRVPDAARGLGLVVSAGGAPGEPLLVARYERRKGLAGGVCVWQTSGDLLTWNAVDMSSATEDVSAGGEPGLESVTLTMPMPAGAASTFLRLSVSQP